MERSQRGITLKRNNSRDGWVRYWEGVVDAYLELLQTGIREVCLPNIGAHHTSELEWIDRKAGEAGVVSLPIRKQARNKAGTPIQDCYHCQRLLYVPGSGEKAHELKQLLESTEGTRERNRERNRRIGQLLGYHSDKIEEFVSRRCKPACNVPDATP